MAQKMNNINCFLRTIVEILIVLIETLIVFKEQKNDIVS